jgi:tRNA nucleotidyltransferase (CCA-adding enzyme)
MIADPYVAGLEVYMVGGAVRDALLGVDAGDRDWVVVGATPEIMAGRGFIPVGGDFPVFLHPRTHEEYALARTERKSGRGYKGFVFHAGSDVSLLDDLRRRDLTINAMARGADGTLVDPLNGQADIRDRVLRHVGAAFVEDPVRLLRLARFAARFHDFSIAPETLALARQLVAEGEVDALVPERVWQELAKGLMSVAPERMLDVLEETGALARVAPGLVWSNEVRAGLRVAAERGLALESRFALLCRASSPGVGKALRAPTACQDMARLLPQVLERLEAGVSDPTRQLELLDLADVWRRPDRFGELLEAASCVRPDLDLDVWSRRTEAARAVDAGAIARAARGDAMHIREGVRAARARALEALARGSL